MGAILIKLIVGVIIVAALGGKDDLVDQKDQAAVARVQAEKALDAMHFENAPTLGPIARKFQLAMTTRQWSDMWDLMADKNHKFYEQMFERDKENIDEQIKGIEETMSQMPDENSKKAMQDYLEKLKKIKAQLPNVHNGKEYFIVWMNVMMAVSTDIKTPGHPEHVEQDMAIVSGEEFSADSKTGWIIFKTVKSNKEFKGNQFINEGGQWKLDWGGGGEVEQQDTPMPQDPYGDEE